MNRPGTVPNGQAGYSLVEVLVAFAILALALTLLLRILSGATRQVREAEEAGRAALHAQSLIAQVGVGASLAPGRLAGELEDGRYRWSLNVAEYEDALLPRPRDPGVPVLLTVSLTVAWDEGAGRSGRVVLHTLRLVRPESDARFPGAR